MVEGVFFVLFLMGALFLVESVCNERHQRRDDIMMRLSSLLSRIQRDVRQWIVELS